jgi:2-dehydro-3-deoxygalactonokinase
MFIFGLMQKFFSCDWGTSSFRLRLIDTNAWTIVDEVTGNQGIAATHTSWKNSEVERTAFYTNFLAAQIDTIKNKAGNPGNIPVLISGMASSTLGIRELEYAPLPFSADGSSAITVNLPSSADFPHTLFLISGVSTDSDVMRGEETQWIGCMEKMSSSQMEEMLFIFPGTHSKHVYVNSGFMRSFKTFMTGEIFELLSTHSVLKNSVESASYHEEPAYVDHFKAGVDAASQSSILHNAFMVRTNQIFNKLSKKQNYFYLSGLVIGTELQAIDKSFEGKKILAAGKAMSDYYRIALEQLDLAKNLVVLSPADLDLAVIKGQLIIFNQNDAYHQSK